MSITEIYEQKCRDNSDMCQHMPTLKKYAEGCHTVVELGVRSVVSTWAFLAAKPVRLISVDIVHPRAYLDYDPDGCNLDLACKLAGEEGIDFQFIQADSLKVELPMCDLMLFDTLHTYEQLTGELNAHAAKVKKYMIFHDTETYKEELMPAILEFTRRNINWHFGRMWRNNNGLCVLKKIKNENNRRTC